ncbi:acyl-CoA dehydrogenase [Cupriavidus sp. SK-4]|uniref:acyl-CoA dehydrogenase n=1 Tax=Cupriavidus sp. SK-4 TaxID=574750 RepID=UPI0004523CE1|nr:acyl-CoA dehydrogenase [Cupriavidus sp. SK-4]EYS87465.1 acyl-CoA dehydrogenase [Cupriavidus sp. SK-4]
MDFRRDPNRDAFREEVRAFLRERLPAALVGRKNGVRSERAELVQWQRILNAHGWGAPYWSSEHGGTGWTVQQRLVFDEECAAAGAPSQDNFAQKLVGPVLNHFATPRQKAEHLPPIFSGERLWCQGFSEPGSGSDLASLRTQAVRDGGHYLVNGQKIWTSYAHQADWIFLLVRTDPSVKKQAGISFLLVDMKTPGITVRPIISIDGRHHLNETFFDNVRVPMSNLVGAEGEGWKLTKFLLNNEHASAADLPTLLRMLNGLKSLARRAPAGTGSLLERHEFALRLARLEAEVRAISVLVQRVAAMEADHSPAAHAMGSILKLRGTELQQKLSEFLVESLGDHGAVACPAADGHFGAERETSRQDPLGDIASEMFYRRAATIYGGSSEIQRGIIAKMMFQF